MLMFDEITWDKSQGYWITEPYLFDPVNKEVVGIVRTNNDGHYAVHFYRNMKQDGSDQNAPPSKRAVLVHQWTGKTPEFTFEDELSLMGLAHRFKKYVPHKYRPRNQSWDAYQWWEPP